MKIRKVFIKEYKVFRDFEINFCDENDKPLDIIVIAGINGSGKTSLLKAIFNINDLDSMEYESYLYSLIHHDVDTYKEMENERVRFDSKAEKNIYEDNNIRISFVNESKGQLLYSPISEYGAIEYIDRGSYAPTIDYFENENKKMGSKLFDKEKILLNNPKNIVTEKIKDYMDFIKDENEDLTVKEANKLAIDSINKIFEDLNIEIKFKGLSKDTNREVIFSNGISDNIKLDGLSSGEKELFIRILSLKILNLENSVILIDEPETSLHPSWQNRILSVYEMIAKEKNNQIIIATHSPQIIASANHKNLIALVKEDEKIKAKYFKYPPLDRDVNTILKTIMKSDFIPKKLEELCNNYRNMVENGEIETQKAKELKEKILTYIDENSEFFQGINFYLDMME